MIDILLLRREEEEEEEGIYPPSPTSRYMNIQKSISDIGPIFFEE